MLKTKIGSSCLVKFQVGEKNVRQNVLGEGSKDPEYTIVHVITVSDVKVTLEMEL